MLRAKTIGCGDNVVLVLRFKVFNSLHYSQYVHSQNGI